MRHAPRRLVTRPLALLRLGACAAALAALAPRTADAQLGRLRDIGKAVAKGAAEGAAGGAVNKAAGRDASGAPIKASEVRFTENVLEITDERIAALIRGLDAEEAAKPEAERKYLALVAAAEQADKAYAGRQAAYEREHGAWVKRDEQRRACVDAVEAKHAKGIEAEAQAGQGVARKAEAEMDDAREKRMLAYQERMLAAQQRGDQRAMAAIADTVRREIAGIMAVATESNVSTQRVMAKSAAMEAEMKRCGDLPPEPKAPERAMMPNASEAQAAVQAAGVKASGLTDRQYNVLRERVEAYIRLNGRGYTQYVFSAGELDALARGSDGLKARGKALEEMYWVPGEKRS